MGASVGTSKGLCLIILIRFYEYFMFFTWSEIMIKWISKKLVWKVRKRGTMGWDSNH